MQTLFERAGSLFDGWTDPDTGLRVLRLRPTTASGKHIRWATIYHQFRCFLNGGKQALLHEHNESTKRQRSIILDLTTGSIESPCPADHYIFEVADKTNMATIAAPEHDGTRVKLWNLRADREEASVPAEGWNMNCPIMLSDGQRALVIQFQGKFYSERVQTRHILLTPGQKPQTILEADGYFCNHIQSCPTDPELYSYNRWPSPMRDVDQVLHIRKLDGSLHEPIPLAPEALRPGNTLGVRDHYLWTPDAARIISYLCPHPIVIGPDFNHYKIEWWLSSLDWRTGEDVSVVYPPGRWGAHMQVSPDSRQIICAGGPGYDKLFLVSIDGLRKGWNETPVCSYPTTVSSGQNHCPFPYPAVLPDQSGILFNAGWPGPEHGAYLAAWPKSLD